VKEKSKREVKMNDYRAGFAMYDAVFSFAVFYALIFMPTQTIPVGEWREDAS
jgi:hypothetical protein